MNIANFIMKILAIKAGLFEKSTGDPVKVQKKVLLEFINRNKDTEYGKKYHFSSIRSVDEYRKCVPLADYEDLRPYVNRMAKGEQNVLIADEPTFFAITSGTTSKPKLIPVSKYSRSREDNVMDIWTYYIARDYPDVFKGKFLAIVSPALEGYTESGLSYGAESGHVYKTLPGIVRRFYALPYQVFDIWDYDARYYCILRLAMQQNITTIGTLNPNTITLLCRKIEKWQEKIIKDIEKGTIDEEFDIPDEIRRVIEKACKPDPERARELRAILKEKGKLLPMYFWPDLKLIECWKAGTMKLYLKELPRYFGDTPIRDIGCHSTEAHGSVPMSDEGGGGVLAISTNFYEFIPKEDMEKSNKRVLLCDQLEDGKEYFLIVTTPCGLYRYNIDDVIKVNGFFNKTPVIEFVQKGLSAVSIGGEKLYESQVNKALSEVLSRSGLSVEFFCVTVQHEAIPRYVFLVEFSQKTSFPERKRFLKAMEEELSRQNSEYGNVRRSQIIASPVMKVAQQGEAEKYRLRKVQEGSHDGQFKVPRLKCDPDFYKNFQIEDDVYLEK